MDLTFLGGAREIGASSLLLEVAGHRLLIDGGMRPTASEGARLPDLAPLDERPPEAILITHAHIDHTGGLPLIAGLYPAIPIYATESTIALMQLLLRDSVRIMEQEQLQPDGETPLYSAEQVDALLARITPVAFHQLLTPLVQVPAITMRFLPAGHILGAAMLLIETPEGRLLHTGDVSVTDQRTVKGLAMDNLPQAEVMICEGTYGNRSHANRREEERGLVETCQAIVAGGGRVLLPAFAVGRAQELVLILKAFRASRALSPVPIYLDGMVRSVCSAYQIQSHDLHPSLQRFLLNARRPLFADPELQIFSVQREQRTALLGRESPFMVISSSGMLTGGASPLYAAAWASRPQDGIIFSGYQDEESPGAALLKAQHGSVVRLQKQRLLLQCQVARYSLSAHADAEQLVHVIQKVEPDHLLFVHGAPEALEAMARRFPKRNVYLPAVGQTIHLTPRRRGDPSPADDSRVSDAPLSPSAVPALVERPAPTLSDLWRLAHEAGPARPWTEVELGRAYYGDAYRPALRPTITVVLRAASARFKLVRMGAQWAYQPRPEREGDALEDRAAVTAGEIVLVQGGQGAPGLALVSQASQNGVVTLVAEHWKGSQHPFNSVQLRPDIQRQDWLERPLEEVKADLRMWHAQLKEEWVDLMALWQRCREGKVCFAGVCAESATEAERLAWGLEFLQHGHVLFQREGSCWRARGEQEVFAGQEGAAHHLALVTAGAGARVQVGERLGTLTGRSSWQYVEVTWEDGQITRVRPRNAHLLENVADLFVTIQEGIAQAGRIRA